MTSVSTNLTKNMAKNLSLKSITGVMTATRTKILKERTKWSSSDTLSSHHSVDLYR